jgi:hypothetical protein
MSGAGRRSTDPTPVPGPIFTNWKPGRGYRIAARHRFPIKPGLFVFFAVRGNRSLIRRILSQEIFESRHESAMPKLFE